MDFSKNIDAKFFIIYRVELEYQLNCYILHAKMGKTAMQDGKSIGFFVDLCVLHMRLQLNISKIVVFLYYFLQQNAGIESFNDETLFLFCFIQWLAKIFSISVFLLLSMK